MSGREIESVKKVGYRVCVYESVGRTDGVGSGGG